MCGTEYSCHLEAIFHTTRKAVLGIEYSPKSEGLKVKSKLISISNLGVVIRKI